MDKTQDKIIIYFIGTAGSGKTTLCGSFAETLEKEGGSVYRVNLDPGVDTLPYTPDYDIRNHIDLFDVMEEYELGPNGAQIACADNIAFEAKRIASIINSSEGNYVIIDTPGQIELFAYRNSSSVIIEELGSSRSFFVFLMDPFLAHSPSGFITQHLLYLSCQFKFHIPSMIVLSKSDMIELSKIEEIIAWSSDPDSLYASSLDEIVTVRSQFHIEVLRSLMDLDLFTGLFPCSSETGEGLLDIYNYIQQIYSGGEDISD